MPSDAPIAVTGATGYVGGRVAAGLAERGIAQRLIVRDAARAPRLDGAEVRGIGGYDASDELRAALDGCGTLLFVPAHEERERKRLHEGVVAAAAAAGIEHIVYFSMFGARADSTFTFGRDHFATEQAVRATNMRPTFLRMNFYIDVLPLFAGEDGVIRGPAGDGRVAAIARDDLADCALAVLTQPAVHRDEVYEISGPEALTLDEAAETMTRISGKPIRFENETLEQARASRARFEPEDWQLEGWISTYTAIANGELENVTDSVRRLTGRDPKSLADYLREHPDCLGHVA